MIPCDPYHLITLTSGYNLVMRNILLQLVEPACRSILLTTVTMLESISSVVAGPFFSLSFRAEMALSGHDGGNGNPSWIGLPFMAAAGLLVITVATLYSIRVS